MGLFVTANISGRIAKVQNFQAIPNKLAMNNNFVIIIIPTERYAKRKLDRVCVSFAPTLRV